MKTLLTLLLTTCFSLGQTTGQFYYQKKAAVGYTSHYLTPSEGRVPVWVSGGLGNLDIAGTYATQTSLGAYSLTSHAHTFGSITSKPTTLSGYGITDAPSGSGTSTGANSGDNAANTTYAADYRVANFVAGTNYLAPNGSAASLTGFPALNQNTTGSAATLTTARTVNGVSFNGSANIGQDLQTTASPTFAGGASNGIKIMSPSGNANDFLAIGSNGNNRFISSSANALGISYSLIGDATGGGGPMELRMGSGATLTWRSTTRADAGSADITVGRNSAGVLGIQSAALSGTFAVTGTSTLGGLTITPAATATPATNGQLTFEATSNTSLTLKLKGTDGTVRGVVLTLTP